MFLFKKECYIENLNDYKNEIWHNRRFQKITIHFQIGLNIA